jgi:hypothetical protein
MRKVAQFAGINWTGFFERRVQELRLSNNNYKWREELTPKQQWIMNEVIGNYLERYGYL